MDDTERLGARPQVLVEHLDHEAAAIVAARGGADRCREAPFSLT